jgi:nitroreductase
LHNDILQAIAEENNLSETCFVPDIQNLWLAARTEGIGVGWVSILDPVAIKDLLRIPASARLVAYLFLEYVKDFSEVPDLERDGWEQRAELSAFVCADYFDRPYELPRNI